MFTLKLLLQLLNFNSIKVRLEHNLNLASKRAKDYFNSIKVRLEPRWLIGTNGVNSISIP